jgi:hypothetical protein
MHSGRGVVKRIWAVERTNDIARAIRRCQSEGKAAFEKTVAAGGHRIFAEKAFNDAFKAAMPELSNKESIQAFIACVAKGMSLRVITQMEAKPMLYMAQTAISACKLERKRA